MSIIKPAIQYPVLIAYLSGANNYTWLIFRNGEKKLLAKPISYLEEQLAGFIRIHKTTLINPDCVEQLHHPPRPKMAGAVQLEGGVVLPVSRRRWSRVSEQLHLQFADHASRALSPALVPVSTAATARKGIVAVTDDDVSRLLLRRIFEQKWPYHPLHVLAQRDNITPLFEQLPEAKLPVLIVLDARTATPERLRTLERLKEHRQLRQIPVVLLVSATGRAVVNGYQRRANSVICLPDDHAAFSEAIERIGQFWLQTAALPVLANSSRTDHHG